jgi:hypothetical protein
MIKFVALCIGLDTGIANGTRLRPPGANAASIDLLHF